MSVRPGGAVTVLGVTYPSAAQSESFAISTARQTVRDYLPRTFHDGTGQPGKCEWSAHAVTQLTQDELGALAWVVIEAIMRARFGSARHLYEAWRDHTLAVTALPDPRKSVIASFIEPVFGLPGSGKSADHIQGHVGEWLWHLLTHDTAAVRVQPAPKGDVTDAGGDGFSIYEAGGGDLRFRLWESKKNTGNGALSGSLNKAYAQIDAHGQRYVAKIVGTFAQGHAGISPDVVALVNELPEAWERADKVVGAGVTLATHQHLPADPFQNMSAKLPSLQQAGQLRGLATSVDSYVALAELVRGYAWTAL